MQKNLLIIILISLNVLFVKAQKDIGLAITTNLFNLAARGPSINIEKSVGKKGSMNIYFSKGNFGDHKFLNYNSYKFQTALLEYRIYPFKKSDTEKKLQGLHFGIYGKYMKRDLYRIAGDYVCELGDILCLGSLFTPSAVNFNGQSLGAGISSGGQMVFGKRFVVGFFSGFGASGYIKQFDEANPENKRNGYFDLRFGLQFGIKF